MFRNKTVFVLGAGASFEAGMPVGIKLAENISRLLDFGWDGNGHFIAEHNRSRSFFNNVNPDACLSKEIAKGIRFSHSIDDYIDRRKDKNVVQLGKAAIAYEILSSERASKLYVDRDSVVNGLETKKIADTWYLSLARMLFRPTDVESVTKVFEKLSFIDFNYDRCLDQFFYYALRDAYSLDPNRTDELLKSLKRHKPYGSIGPLPTAKEQNALGFGQDPNHTSMYAIVPLIKTYTEQIDTKSADDIKAEFASAHTVVFLGFGFHEQNMRLLNPNSKTKIKKVLATAKGVSENDQHIIREFIGDVCNSTTFSTSLRRQSNIAVRDLTCARLFDEYRLTLQAA